MSFQQKNALASLISTILIFTIYAITISSMHSAGRFAGVEGLALLGKSVLIMIILGIIATIGITILLSILHAILTNEPKPSFVIDERDRVIDLRATRVFFFVVGAGFCLAMLYLALGRSPFMVFNMIIFAFGMGSLISSLWTLAIYRKGA